MQEAIDLHPHHNNNLSVILVKASAVPKCLIIW